MKINETGRSMVEMLGVLAVVGMLTVGGITGYSKAMTKYKINKTVDIVMQINSNIRTLYASQKNFSGLDCYTNVSTGDLMTTGCAALKKAHVVPGELWVSDTEIRNPLGGTIQTATSRKKSGDRKAFIILVNKLPKDVCINLASNDWGGGSASGLVAMGINSSLREVYQPCDGSKANGSAVACPNGSTVSVPMPLDVASKACKNGLNYMQLKFY